MMKILRRTNKTTVKIFINTLICATALISTTSLAEESTSFIERPKVQASDDAIEKLRQGERCDNLRRDARDAERKISDACKSAGLGGECASKAKKCSEEMEEESFDTFSTAMSAFGLPSTASASQIQGACPQWSAKDFYDKQKEYKDDLKSAKEDLAKITEDKAAAEKDMNDELAKIQEELNEAQEELDALPLKQNDTKRERLQKFQENQAQLKSDIQKNKIEKIQLEGQLLAKLQTAAQELLQVSVEAGNRTCRDAVAKKREQDRLSKSKKGMGGLIGGGNTANQDYLEVYNTCIATIDAQRKLAIQKKTTDEATIRQQLVANEETANQLQQSLETSQSQLNEIEADAQKEKDNAQTKVIKQMQLAQQKMTAANSNMQKKLQALQQKEQALNAEINSINSDMTMVLGSKPKSGSTSTANEAASVIDGEVESIMDYARSGCDGAPSASSVSKKYDKKIEKSRNR